MSTVKSKKIQLGVDATASNNFTIYQPDSPDGTLRIGVGNADSPTEVARFDSIPSYFARAWVNFDGTGTVAIRDSGNVSSITDNGTGDYTVTFVTAMPNTNYAVQNQVFNPSNVTWWGGVGASNTLTTSVRIFSNNSSFTLFDSPGISVTVHC